MNDQKFLLEYKEKVKYGIDSNKRLIINEYNNSVEHVKEFNENYLNKNLDKYNISYNK